MSGPASWSTDELRAEIVDLTETAEHLGADIPTFEIKLERQLARTVDVYGLDETCWPCDSLHCVRTMRADLAARRSRLADVLAIRAEYERSLARR